MRKNIVVFACCCLLLAGCSKKVYIQDENSAIETTNNFFKAIMTTDYQKAYESYLSPGIKFGPKATLDYFKADWDAIVAKYGKFEKATFESWQLVPGKHVLQLYYLVKHENVDAPVEYHFALEGYKEKGYTIFLVDIGNEQKYPPNIEIQSEKQKNSELIEVLP